MASDKKEKDLIIEDKKRYGAYSTEGKTYFDGMMRAMLGVVPLNETGDTVVDDMLEKMQHAMAENFAFYVTDTYLTITDEKIDVKINKLKEELLLTVNTSLNEIKQQLAANSAATTTNNA